MDVKDLKKGLWVLIDGFDYPGKIRSVVGSMFFVDFLADGGGEAMWMDPLHVSLIERIIGDPKEISDLEKEMKG